MEESNRSPVPGPPSLDPCSQRGIVPDQPGKEGKMRFLTHQKINGKNLNLVLDKLLGM